MADRKRKADEFEPPASTALVMSKVPRPDDMSLIASEKKPAGALSVVSKVKRTSSLLSPTVLLTGHQGAVHSMKFSPDGESMASGSFDKTIYLWKIWGQPENHAVLKGHTNAVLEVQYTSNGSVLLSASADQTLATWDLESLTRVRRFREHAGVVNSVCPSRRGRHIFASGSDDGTCRIWDIRSKRSIETLRHKYPILSVAMSEQGEQVYAAGVDNVVHVWDVRKASELFTMEGHTHTITGLKLSPDGTHLLSNSMDNTLRMWDVRPFVRAGESREVKVFTGHRHGVDQSLLRCSWSPDGTKVAAGSSDSPSHVYIWDVNTRQMLYKLPGHSGAIHEVEFHPTQPVIGSCSSDKKIYLGEIDE